MGYTSPHSPNYKRRPRWAKIGRSPILWRLLYIPICVFMGGLLYFHLMLIENMRYPQFYDIEGVSEGSVIAEDPVTKAIRAIGRAKHIGDGVRVGKLLLTLNKTLENSNQIHAKVQLVEAAKAVHAGSNNSVRTLRLKVPFIAAWEDKLVTMCGGLFKGFSNKMVLLKDVLITKALAKANATGGEDILSVKNRLESSESYTFKPGFFLLPCAEGARRSKFKPDKSKAFLPSWYNALKFDGPVEYEAPPPPPPPKFKLINNITKLAQKGKKAINKSIQPRVDVKQQKQVLPDEKKQIETSMKNITSRLQNKLPPNVRALTSISENEKPGGRRKILGLLDMFAEDKGAVPFVEHDLIDTQFTLALTRYEYANLYWVLTDIYTAYLVLSYFGQNPQNTQILFIDAKPRSHMDPLWSVFFGKVTLLAELPEKVRFKTLVWCFERANSPTLKRKPLPLHTEFRRQMFSAFDIPLTTPDLHGVRYGKNCSAVGLRKLNVLFIWRRNYVAHPRNPSGIVSRKIANEEEIINATTRAFPRYNVRGEQLDNLPMREQVRIIADTDVLIGMHGAAFAFTWFLPQGSGAIEMFPTNVASNWHMRHIAESNSVHYDSWKNNNPKNERFHSKSTVVPPDIAIGLIRDMVNFICTGVPKKRPRPQKPPRKAQPRKMPPKPVQSNANVLPQVSNIHRNQQKQKQEILGKSQDIKADMPKPMGLQAPH